MLRSREHKSEFHDFKLLAESKFCGGCISSYNLGVWSHRFGWGCRNLQLTLLCSFVAGEAIARIIPHRPRLVTLQDNKVRHPTPLFPYHVRISRNLARRLSFERDTVGNMWIFAYL